MEEDGFGKLGFYSVAVVFLTSGFFTLFTTTLIAKFSARVCLGIGALCNGLWVISSLFAAIKHEY